MTIMAQQKLATKREEWPSKRSTSKEAIHSGHFMVSSFEAEAQDDEDELAVPVPETEDSETTKVLAVVQPTGIGRQVVPCHTVIANSPKFPWHNLPIETSLSKLFHCMSIAYRQKLTSPKWNRFKGIRLRWKDKIRLNNVIWRCWHMQFIKKKNTLVCQFASPLDADTHNKPEAVVLEGKYWKRKLNAVTAEYKKWRMFSHHQIIGKPHKDCQDMLAELEAQEWQISSVDSLMMVDEDYMGLMSDTLFSTITANQPFAFPDTREIARGANLADFIQPSLVQLQPNLDDYMDIEPLNDFLCSKLPSVPEDPEPLPPTANYLSGKLLAQSPASFDATYPPHHVWYLPPESNFSAPPPPSIHHTPTSSQRQQQQSSQSTQQEVSAVSYVPQPPPMPPTPTKTLVQLGQPKENVFIVPKQSKTKTRGGRNDSSKKLATSTPSSPNAPPQTAQSTVGQVQMSPPTSGQNNALLAQLLTNAGNNSSFNYVKNEQSPQYSYLGSSSVVQQSSKNIQPLGSSDLTYLQSAYQPVENSVVYQNESELNKSSYLVNSNNNSSSTASSSSHPSSPQNMISSSLIMKSTQPSISAGLSPSSVCPESPGVSDSLSLSPLNVGSPTSPTGSKTGYKVDHRRVCHINAEQKRRCNIKNGFDTLHSLIPQLNQNPSAKMSKAAMLQKGADYIRQLQNERHLLKQEMEGLRQQIDVLNTDICNCQSLLPATGAPVSKHRSNKMRDMYRKYVRVRTHENWKFWILSLICEPLLESFNNNVSTVNLDELYRTTLQWVDQHCTLVDLRPVVLNALRLLCTTTEVLSDPASLPNEARNTVDKAVKKT